MYIKLRKRYLVSVFVSSIVVAIFLDCVVREMYVQIFIVEIVSVRRCSYVTFPIKELIKGTGMLLKEVEVVGMGK
jgi:hypothetical protein